MADGIVKILEDIKEKLAPIDTWGHKVCSLCEAREYPVDSNGMDRTDIDRNEAEWVFDHAYDCIATKIDECIKRIEGQSNQCP